MQQEIKAGDSVWRDGRALSLPPLRGERRADVCVVGLGGSGLSAIEELHTAGVDVIGVDAGRIAAGAAGANGGFLLAGLAQFHHDAVARFGRERALGIYAMTRRELDARFATPDSSCRRTGSLRIAAGAEEEADCVRQIEAMQRDGLAAEPYIGAEGRGVLIPDDGVFDPALHWGALAARLRGAGVALYGDTLVQRIDAGRVDAAQGRVHAECVVVAVDGGLEALLPQLVGDVRSARLQMLATVPAPELALTRPVYCRDGHDYWQQLGDGRIVLGGGRDIGGDAEWQHDGGVSARVQAHLEHLLRHTLGTRAAITHRWSARVAFTTRGLPQFGALSPQLFVTGAYNGTGNIFGALCGRALAQRVLGRHSELSEWLA